MINDIAKETNIISNDNQCRKLSHKGKVIWLFGLSGSGKSTIADRIAEILTSKRSQPTYRLDGDGLRTGLNSDLSFSDQDRRENIRRTAEVAKLFADAGFLVIVSLITPLQSMRTLARSIVGEERYFEVYVKASLETCEARDPKGLYDKVRKGEIKEFTGIDAPFEESLDSDLVINTEQLNLDNSVEKILRHIIE